MGVSDYIMGSKSMMFLTSSQRHVKLVFNSSYFLYSYNKSVVRFKLNYLESVGILGVKGYGRIVCVSLCLFDFSINKVILGGFTTKKNSNYRRLYSVHKAKNPSVM